VLAVHGSCIQQTGKSKDVSTAVDGESNQPSHLLSSESFSRRLVTVAESVRLSRFREFTQLSTTKSTPTSQSSQSSWHQRFLLLPRSHMYPSPARTDRPLQIYHRLLHLTIPPHRRSSFHPSSLSPLLLPPPLFCNLQAMASVGEGEETRASRCLKSTVNLRALGWMKKAWWEGGVKNIL
jgi:hypothetical protein